MDITDIIKKNNREEIYKLIHKKSPNPNPIHNMDDYNIEDRITELSLIPSFKKQINSLPITDIDDLLSFFDRELDIKKNNLVRVSIASVLNGKNAMALLQDEIYPGNTPVLLMVIMRALRRNSFLEKLDTYTKTYNIKQFYRFAREDQAMTDVIKGCQAIYKKMINDTHKFKQFEGISNVFNIQLKKDHIQRIKSFYQPFNEDVLKPRLRMLIDTLRTIYNTHKPYYIRQREYEEEMGEVQNQLGIEDVQEPFDDYVAEYLETPKKRKMVERSNSKNRSSSKSVSFGIPPNSM